MTDNPLSGLIQPVSRRRLIYLLALIIALAVLAFGIPLNDILRWLNNWTRENAELAAWALGGVFALGVMLLLPVSAVVLMAGFVLGLVKGLIVIWLAGLVSSTLAFLAARTLARTSIERRLEHHGRLARFDNEIAKRGFWMVMLSRLATVLPFGPLSYAWGLSKVRFRDYVLGTNLGAILPYILVVYLGTTAQDVAAIIARDVTLGESGLLLGLAGALVLAILVTLISRIALRIMRNMEGQKGSGHSAPGKAD